MVLGIITADEWKRDISELHTTTLLILEVAGDFCVGADRDRRLDRAMSANAISGGAAV